MELKLHEAFYRRNVLAAIHFLRNYSGKHLNNQQSNPVCIQAGLILQESTRSYRHGSIMLLLEGKLQDCCVAPPAFVLHSMCQRVGRVCPFITTLTLDLVKNRSCKYVTMSDVRRLVSTMAADKISMASSSHTVSTLWHSESNIYLILLKKSRSQGELNFFLKVILMLFTVYKMQPLLAMLIKSSGTNRSHPRILNQK